MMNQAKNIGELANIQSQEPMMKKASGEFAPLMNLEQLLDIVGAENVEVAIREMVGSNDDSIKLQGLMLMEEFKNAIGGNFQ